MPQTMRQRDPGNGHQQLVTNREIQQRLPARRMLLRENHRTLWTSDAAPLPHATPQRPHLTSREFTWMKTLQFSQ